MYRTKKLLFFITILLFIGIGSATPVPMGPLTNNDTFLDISTYDGSNQLVHPCVIYTASGWNGYTYLMSMTPYPYSDAHYENPSMRYSNDGITWVKISGQPDPIIAKPAVGYNSDPNIELVGNTLYLFYRYVNGTESAEVWYNYTATTDGVTWTTPEKLSMDKTRSNSFVYNGTGWESWGHNTTSLNLVHYTSSDITTWSEPQAITINSAGFTQCHSEVKLYDGQYQLLLSDNPLVHLRFYTSSDGMTWNSENNNNPVLTGRTGYWDEKIYKSSFVETDNSYKVWYSGITNSWVFKVGLTQYPGFYKSASLTVTAPDGKEIWQRSTSHTVTWDYTGSPGSYVKIVLLEGGNEVGTISPSTPTGSSGKSSHTWTISSTRAAGSDYKVSVQSISHPAIRDTSNDYFTITSPTTTPSATVTAPNGKETWQRGTPHTVTWNYTGSLGSYVKIVLLKGVSKVGTISPSAPTGSNGKGSYTWPINPSGTTGSDYTVSVQSISQPTIKDTSNNYFTISSAGTPTSAITVTSPNGGETWKRGTTQTVKWSYTGNPGSYVKVVLLKTGIEVGTATYSTSIGSGGTGSYSWTISSGRAPGTDYRIRVTSVSQPAISDTSNGDFTITT